MTWSNWAHWWREELAHDPAYEQVVTPLLVEMLRPESGLLYLDLGCGEGRIMRKVSALGAMTHGVDLSEGLIVGVQSGVIGNVLNLPMRSDSYDGVYCVLTLEHIEDHLTFFREAGRVVRPGGVMALVINHPVWTAPHSTPVTDFDGEVLWRSGDYFGQGTADFPAREGTVSFFHRSMADLLNAAAESAWCLQRMVEQPHHEFEDQSGIPRLLGCRWTRN